jgi:hypothetical protein
VRLRACEVVDVLECQDITQVAQRLNCPAVRAIRMSDALHNSVNEQHAAATGQKRCCIVESTGVSVDEMPKIGQRGLIGRAALCRVLDIEHGETPGVEGWDLRSIIDRQVTPSLPSAPSGCRC